VAVWSRAVGGMETVEAADMAPGGWWLDPVDLTGSGEDATEPDVAMAGGRAVAVWSLAGPGPYSTIQARERVDGAGWQPSHVYPSGSAVATVCAPMLPPAPGRFSITTGWPQRCCSLSAM